MIHMRGGSFLPAYRLQLSSRFDLLPAALPINKPFSDNPVYVQVTKRISNPQPPIADLEHPYAFSAIDTVPFQ
jgi:hypothetical protein